MVLDFRTEVIGNALNLFRHHIPSERYDVLLFIIILYRYQLVHSSTSSHQFIEELKSKINHLDEDDRIVFEELFNIYASDLKAINLSNAQSIVSHLSFYTFEDQKGFNFGDFFEKVILEISPYIYSRHSELMVSQPIIRLMNSLADYKENISVYNPFAGTASFGIELADNNSYYGQEVNGRTWALGIMRLLAHNKDISRFKLEDSFFSREFDREEFDVVLSVPPINVKIDSDSLYKRYGNTAEEFALMRGYECLKPGGSLVVLVSNSKLCGSKLNKYLVDQGALAAVIHLPTGVFEHAIIATSLIVLKKSYQKEVLLIDASKEFEKGKRKFNNLSSENIDKIISCYRERTSITDFCLKVSNNEICENEYYLTYQRYAFSPEILSQSLELDPNSSLVKLGDILQNIKSSKALGGDKGKVIRIKDLSDDLFNPYIIPNALAIESLIKPWQKITSPVILLSKRFNNLKPSFIETSESNPVYISPDILAFKVSDHIDVNYLVWQLGSEFVKRQLESYSGGFVMPNITAKNLLQIVIQLPSIDKQQYSLFLAAKQQADKEKIVQANLQGTIDALIKDRFEEFQWDLHDIRNSELLAISQQAEILSKIMQRNPDVAQTVVDPKKNINLQDYMEKLLVNTQALTKKISTIYDFATAQEQFEEFDIVKFVENFMKTQEHLDLEQINYELITDNIQEIYALGMQVRVKFNKADLTLLLNNIVENVKRHASFDPENSSLNKFSIVIEVPNSNRVKISFLNSGNRTEVTSSMYFSRDRKWGKTGNTGMGGYAIKKLANRNSAQVDMETFAEGEYVFGVNLLINREYDFIL